MVEWRWTERGMERLAETFMGIGHVMFGSVVIPLFFETYDPTNALAGFMFAIAFWVFSLLLSNQKL